MQTLRERKSKVSPRTFGGKYLLTGLIRCPRCGSPMVASRTVNYLKDGTRVVRKYYSCGNFRNRGSSVCSANSVGADYAESQVIERIRGLVNRPGVLKGIVERINRRKVTSVKPLGQELKAVEKALSQQEAKRRKYLELYEADAIDRGLLVGRLEELATEANRLQARKSEIEYELQGDTSRQVPLEYVKWSLERLDRLLRGSPPERSKTLLHLVVKEIRVNAGKIESVELAFDEKTQKHLIEEAPSERESEGAFAFPGRGKGLPRFSIVV